MSWSPETSCGFESAKIKYEALPYLARGGLDIGCGPSKIWPHLLGIDSGKDTELFGVAMKPDLVMPDAARLGLFADGAIENVFSSHLLEHIADWQPALSEWWRVLKVGGHLALYLPHADLYPNVGQPGANPDHKHDFRPRDIIDFCALAFADWTLCENQERAGGDEYSFLLVLRKEAAGAGQKAADRPAGKTAGIVRIGAKGDALWASSPAALFKEQGYHVTVFAATTGEEVLRHDPNIDRIVTLPNNVLTDDDLLAFWAHQATKFDRWANLIGSVEQRLLYHPSSNEFFLPQALRQRFGAGNYLEMIHDYAGLPHDFRQHYFATADELAWARATREKLLPAGPLVILNACGSGPAKTWPHAQRFIERMAAAGIVTVVLGDLRDLDLEEVNDYTAIIGNGWPVRGALAFAQIADAVVGTESMIANSVAMADMLKVILLSHSGNENLTKHWKNTAALESPVACHPCHRIHASLDFCAKDTVTGRAACMASYGADTVADFVIEKLAPRAEVAA